MATTTAKVHQRIPFHFGESAACGTRAPVDDLKEPGAYVCNWSGHLMRIPPVGVVPGSCATISLVGAEPLFVTKICENPYVAISDARLAASDLDLPVNF